MPRLTTDDQHHSDERPSEQRESRQAFSLTSNGLGDTQSHKAAAGRYCHCCLVDEASKLRSASRLWPTALQRNRFTIVRHAPGRPCKPNLTESSEVSGRRRARPRALEARLKCFQATGDCLYEANPASRSWSALPARARTQGAYKVCVDLHLAMPAIEDAKSHAFCTDSNFRHANVTPPLLSILTCCSASLWSLITFTFSMSAVIT